MFILLKVSCQLYLALISVIADFTASSDNKIAIYCTYNTYIPVSANTTQPTKELGHSLEALD